MKRKNIVILGSTGSIGVNTLKVIDRYPQQFKVVGLSAYGNLRLFEKQIRQYRPAHVAVSEKKIAELKKRCSRRAVKIVSVEQDADQLVSRRNVDVVVLGMTGSAALRPFLTAVRHGKTVAPANKEALVVAGDIIMREAKRNKARIIPVDSEQSAIFQCLDGQSHKEIKKIHLTASGGSLRDVPASKFKNLTVAKVLRHPRWKMGRKITVDSATLMNKGFEIIEACRLFDLDVKTIDVLIHPEAIIHSMVEFVDGSIIAQLGETDMRIPIQYALTYPQRQKTGLRQVDFTELGQLNFEKPNFKKFPALSLAYYVARKGGTLPSVLNAADEIAVDAFLEGKIKFPAIFKLVEKVVRKHKIKTKASLPDILKADIWARDEARKLVR